MASAPFKWYLRFFLVTKNLLPRWHQQRWVILFPTMWCALMEEAWLGYNEFFFSLLFSLLFSRNSCITSKTTVVSSILWFYRFLPSFSWSLFYLVFDAFELLFFKFYSILFLIRFDPSTFNCSIYMFYTFLDYYFFAISFLSILLHLFS